MQEKNAKSLIDQFATMNQCKINVTRCERLNVIHIVGPLFPKFSQKKEKTTEMKKLHVVHSY